MLQKSNHTREKKYHKQNAQNRTELHALFLLVPVTTDPCNEENITTQCYKQEQQDTDPMRHIQKNHVQNKYQQQ
jgi:hypothetical protein